MFKIILLISAFVFLFLVGIKMVPYFIQIITPEGREAFKVYIQSLNTYGFLIIIGLQLVKIFFFFLPGEPIEILAGMCYGTIGGLLVIYLGVCITSSLIVLLVKKLGRNFIYTFVSQEKIEKIENIKLLQSKKLESVLLVLFIIPGTPKDLLVYLGALLPIHPIKFIILTTLIRFPNIISSTMVGDNLLEGNWYMVIIVYICSFLFSIIVVCFNYRKNGKKFFIKNI